MIQDDIRTSKVLLAKACFDPSFSSKLIQSFYNIISTELPNQTLFQFNDEGKYFEIQDNNDTDINIKLHSCITKQLYLYYIDNDFKNILLNIDPNSYHTFYNLISAIQTTYAMNPTGTMYTIDNLSEQLFSILYFGNGYFRVNLI